MQPVRLLILLGLVAAVFAQVSAVDVVVAHGDPLDFYGYDAPTNLSEPFNIWVFGAKDNLYNPQRVSNVDQYQVLLPAASVEELDPGRYDLYVQFPGQNGQFDISYLNSTLSTIYRTIPDVNIAGADPRLSKGAFDNLASTKPIDDVILKHTVTIEDPTIKVRNMYNKVDGSLHLDIDTNLKTGDKIYAVIDEEVYGKGEYANLMSDTAIVTGDSSRMFSLDFPLAAADMLPPAKTHVISVHFLSDGVSTIPFKTYGRYVEPTPTKVYEKYYDFSGQLIGYDINTTAPAPEPTLVKNPEKQYETVLSDVRIDINNRTVPQRGTIYLGEKNLDIYGTLGWESNYRGYYVFTVQYCDSIDKNINNEDTADIVDSEDVIVINEPTHFYVDPDLFKGRMGAWCQHQTGLYEEHPPVAFFVERGGVHYNLTSGKMENILFNVSNTSLTGLLNVTDLVAYNQSQQIQEPVNISANVTTVETTVIPTPTEIPTTEAITIPLPLWVVLAAIGATVVMRR